MAKKPISIEVVQEGDERFMIRTFADGETTRELIVKLKAQEALPRSSILALGFKQVGKKRRGVKRTGPRTCPLNADYAQQ